MNAAGLPFPITHSLSIMQKEKGRGTRQGAQIAAATILPASAPGSTVEDAQRKLLAPSPALPLLLGALQKLQGLQLFTHLLLQRSASITRGTNHCVGSFDEAAGGLKAGGCRAWMPGPRVPRGNAHLGISGKL